jgi:hypothetical protein
MKAMYSLGEDADEGDRENDAGHHHPGVPADWRYQFFHSLFLL